MISDFVVDEADESSDCDDSSTADSDDEDENEYDLKDSFVDNMDYTQDGN